MTNPFRPLTAAILPSRPSALARVSRRLILACSLFALAFPALAQQAPGSAIGSGGSMRNDVAEQPASLGRSVLTDSMTLSDRAIYLASDLNRMLGSAPGQDQARAEGRVHGVLQRAMALLGTPYRWGGASPDNGFDCSGLVSYVFRTALGIELPRVSRDMARSGELISDRAKLSAGDLVFFGRRGRVDHVGIYVGEGQFVHAPSSGKDVMVSSLDTGYWSNKYMQARRVAGI